MTSLPLSTLREADLGAIERLARWLGLRKERFGTPKQWRTYVVQYIRRAEKRL